MYSRKNNPDLEFLTKYTKPPKEAFRTAVWLLSEFSEEVWLYDLGFKKPKEIDWRIELPDGSLLTAQKNSNLLDGLKHFLIVSTRSASDFYTEANDIKGQQRKRFSYACHLIDILLLNADRYKLHKYGLASLTSGNLKEILAKVASNSVLSESIYDWNEQAKNFYLNILSITPNDLIEKTLDENPALLYTDYDFEDESPLTIQPQIIPRIRAALYINKYYIQHAKFGHAPNTVSISKLVYRNTIWGCDKLKPTHEILCFQPKPAQFRREYSAVKVTTGQGGAVSLYHYTDYRSTLYRLGILHELNIPAPAVRDLIEANSFTPQLSQLGRHRSLPSALTLKCLRDAVEFHLDYGILLIKEFCRVALHCKLNNKRPTEIPDNHFQKIISKDLFDLGVRTFGLSMKNSESTRSPKGSKEQYFSRLRRNEGLLELILIYIGSVQYAVGLFCARRVSELIELEIDQCIDDSHEWLLFHNAKSTRGLWGMRNRIARPIEPIAVDMVNNLRRMHKILKRLGHLSSTTKLFSVPLQKVGFEFIHPDKTAYNRNLDLFCDYFETPTNGEFRYYIRQHQLRRSFAMLFFYSNSFGHLETLRWMLGHNDPSHVWRYITESTDGAVLNSAKAHYVAERLHEGDIESFNELAELLKEKYGTTDFCLTDSHDIEEHIFDLIKEGFVEIEPEFLNTRDGQAFKVIAKVIKKL